MRPRSGHDDGGEQPVAADVAKASCQLRIAIVSDLHYAPDEAADRSLEAAERILRSQQPELILVAGDLTREGLHEQFVPVVEFLSGFDQRRVRAIPGNRDYPAGRPALVRPVDSDLQYFLAAPDTPEMEGEAAGVEPLWTPFVEYFGAVNVFEQREGLTLVGLDSEPEIASEALDQALGYFETAATWRLFFTHRALLPVPRKRVKEGDLLPNAGDILARLLAARVDLIVCAHLHRAHVWRLGDDAQQAVVLNVPSLLDSSGGKENGLVVVDLGEKGDLRLVLYLIDGTTSRTLFEHRHGPRDRKRKRKAAR